MSRQGKTADQIISAAFELACAHGMDYIGSRSVSRHASITASAINYHFGGFDQLRAKVAQVARQEHVDDMRQALTGALNLPIHLRSMPHFVASLASGMATTNRGRTLLLEELSFRHGVPGVDLDRYWVEVCEHFQGEEFPEIWELFFIGVLRFAALDSDLVATPMWVHRVAQRLDARLNRRDDPVVSDPPLLSTPHLLKDGKEHSDRAQRIIDAAIKIITDGEKVSHRLIAKISGVPLGSTTYFFESKSEIIVEAYRQLYWRTVKSTGGVRKIHGTPFLEDGSFEPYYLAVRSLGLSAARDPALLPLAMAMRASRGQSSTAMLRQTGVPNADRLDGLIWSFFNGAAEYLAKAAHGPERQAVFSQKLKDAWRIIFGDTLS